MEEKINMNNAAYELLKTKRLSALRSYLADMNPADIAEFLKELTNDELLLTFRILPKDQAAETFVEMDADEQETLNTSALYYYQNQELEKLISQWRGEYEIETHPELLDD